MITKQDYFIGSNGNFCPEERLAPLFAAKHLTEWPYKHASKKDKNLLMDHVALYEVEEGDNIRSPMHDYVVSKKGFLVILTTKFDTENLYFFLPTDFCDALDFFNKMAKAINFSNDSLD